jgi:hypothetical protein
VEDKAIPGPLETAASPQHHATRKLNHGVGHYDATQSLEGPPDKFGSPNRRLDGDQFLAQQEPRPDVAGAVNEDRPAAHGLRIQAHPGQDHEDRSGGTLQPAFVEAVA